MKLLNYPDPFLRRKVSPVKEIDDSLRANIADMFRLMYEARGVGLAATQVGLDQAIFVINVTGEPSGEQIFINPELIGSEGDSIESEGCLSVPGLEAKVHRNGIVAVRALDINGRQFEVEGTELLARALQHELDHLEGVLFIDRAGAAARIALKGRLKEMERNYDARNSD